MGCQRDSPEECQLQLWIKDEWRLTQEKQGWGFGGRNCRKGGDVEGIWYVQEMGTISACLELRLECIREGKRRLQNQTGRKLFLVSHHQGFVRKCRVYQCLLSQFRFQTNSSSFKEFSMVSPLSLLFLSLSIYIPI